MIKLCAEDFVRILRHDFSGVRKPTRKKALTIRAKIPAQMPNTGVFLCFVVGAVTVDLFLCWGSADMHYGAFIIHIHHRLNLSQKEILLPKRSSCGRIFAAGKSPDRISSTCGRNSRRLYRSACSLDKPTILSPLSPQIRNRPLMVSPSSLICRLYFSRLCSQLHISPIFGFQTVSESGDLPQ